ncbi:hypothetical protein M3O96_02410 [Aquiflexum sp. TKW24L]|uniref:hypothetical protein n=1 Tax=Aquiflexum sp. TKW24L TaxID=2942212 RepID=UPI0020C17D1A|nr:hypothetical protein [Aquiflexum sp. TKW24L]MCL6257925.1 hypothetical protein [Aquiflexum sp. TKW24L]
MKNLTFVGLMLSSGLFIFGPGKVSAQDKPPTKAELEKMMKELDTDSVGRIYTIVTNGYSFRCVKDPVKISPKDAGINHNIFTLELNPI